MTKVFISYSHADSKLALRLVADLQLHGLTVWFDSWDLLVGESLMDAITTAVHNHDVFVILLSPNSVSSEWVKRELEVAFAVQSQGRPIRILPVLLASCDLPPELSQRKCADFRTDYYAGLADLLHALGASTDLVVDTNAHLWLDMFEADLEQVLYRARAAGVAHIVVSGCSGSLSWSRCIALAERYPGLYVSLALHPDHGDADLPLLRSFLAHPKVVAVGDAQLRYYLQDETQARDRQYALMNSHATLAGELDLPLVVETQGGKRDADADLLQIMSTFHPQPRAWIIQNPVKHLDEFLQINCYFLITGAVTYAAGLRSAVEKIPSHRLLLGTDCPWFAPAPLRGKRNEPVAVLRILDTLVQITGLPRETLAQETTATAKNLFRFDQHDVNAHAGLEHDLWKTHG